ncbi:hypothetical protein [Pelagibacterium sp. H642]|uniref:hypothetical protein n=1 Tax=Pelagibacterium sp. H642 TaxID=1881069 RepID=UPI00281593C8|nr:hypothetical protein [Pelagibacterium sp. H642]WMT90169.1 hypothetical protein NO934_15430 [Pelagibacterium sp. H642]
MANRLTTQKGGQHGLWISPPGQDVFTTANPDLLFTSDWAVLGVTDEGIHTVNWNTSGSSGSYDQSVYFARPFTSAPATQMALVVDGATRAMASGGTIFIRRNARHQIGGSYGSVAFYELRTIVYANRIRFLGEWSRNLSSYRIPDLTIAWKAFSYNF